MLEILEAAKARAPGELPQSSGKGPGVKPTPESPLIEDVERRRVLVEWNDTAGTLPHHLNLHQLFEERVQIAPDAVAIDFENELLTYAELNSRANRLARYLRAQRVVPDVAVGIFMERCADLIVAVLAITKAGGAYVPLDPDYPAERLEFMLQETHAPVVLTHLSVCDRLPATSAQTICVDRDWPEIATQADGNLDSIATSKNLAYILFTSGSTGEPKGVCIEQLAVMRLAINTNYVQVSAADCIAQASSTSFDAATFEIWGTLLNGARLAIMPRETVLSAEALARDVRARGITTLFLTTAIFNEHAYRSPQVFGDLDCLLFGGEVCDATAVKRVMQFKPPRRLINAYGPTEATTFATWFEVKRPSEGTLQKDTACEGTARVGVPIGRPLTNTRCYVLDAALEPVPIGKTGELYLGGPGVARGYLNRPELTAERFIENPFCAGDRLYKTGDLVSYQADGNLQYVARADQQIKIRGFRIEPGEIEAALLREEDISRCAVIAREDVPGDQRLVAYVIAKHGNPRPSTQDLRARLAAHLPAYMVPSAFVFINSLPLTANGKLDRRSLPAPSSGCDRDAVAAAGAADEIEQRVRQIWETLLNEKPISLDANFFDLGGHSILAIRLLNAIEEQFNRKMELSVMFKASTIRDQAALLRTNSETPASCTVAIQADGDRAPLFFVSGFGGAILPFYSLRKAFGKQQPLYVLDSNAVAASSEKRLTLVEIAARMIVDLRKTQALGPYHLAGFSLGGYIVYEIAQQLQRAGQPVGMLALLDSPAPGYPRRLPAPIRAVLHVKHALNLTTTGMLKYLVERVRLLSKYFVSVVPELAFAKHRDAAATALARRIRRSATAIYRAWSEYAPEAYPGRVTLIRASEQKQPPGVIDDDPAMGWGRLAKSGVHVVDLKCTHARMLHIENATALAKILSAGLSLEDASRSQSTAAHPSGVYPGIRGSLWHKSS